MASRVGVFEDSYARIFGEQAAMLRRSLYELLTFYVTGKVTGEM